MNINPLKPRAVSLYMIDEIIANLNTNIVNSVGLKPIANLETEVTVGVCTYIVCESADCIEAYLLADEATSGVTIIKCL